MKQWKQVTNCFATKKVMTAQICKYKTMTLKKNMTFSAQYLHTKKPGSSQSIFKREQLMK